MKKGTIFKVFGIFLVLDSLFSIYFMNILPKQSDFALIIRGIRGIIGIYLVIYGNKRK